MMDGIRSMEVSDFFYKLTSAGLVGIEFQQYPKRSIEKGVEVGCARYVSVTEIGENPRIMSM